MIEPVEIIDYEKNKTEIVYNVDARYQRGPKATSKSKNSSSSGSDSESEGMTNHGEASCWLTSVIQAIRASDAFRKQFAPQSNSQNAVKKELF